MGNKKTLSVFITVLFLILIVANASALTAKIGNARMVLRGETGEKITRSILVINDNDIPVNITLTASGDLEDNVDLEENYFVLAPGEEKKAYFTIYANEPGKTETKVNVGFVSLDESDKGNAGFASVITFFATGEATEDSGDTQTGDTTNGGNTVLDDDNGSALSDGEGVSTVMILLIAGAVLIIALIVLLVFASKRGKSNKKRPGRSRA